MPFDSDASGNSTLATLVRVREIIAKGWCQGAYQIGDSYCMVGAIMAATGYWYVGEKLSPNPKDRAWELLAVVFPYSTASATAWNDAPERTKADVLARFDEAIARLMKPDNAR